MVEEHLLDEREFLTPVAPPSVSASEPSYAPGGTRGPVRRYWRGPTWVNSAWLLWLGLRRLGYEEAAARLANGVIGAVEREGLREYYDPRTGNGPRRRGLRLVGARRRAGGNLGPAPVGMERLVLFCQPRPCDRLQPTTKKVKWNPCRGRPLICSGK